MSEALTRKRIGAFVAALFVMGAAFGVGWLLGDDAEEVDSLQERLASVEDQRDDSEAELATSESDSRVLEEELESSREQLRAERSLNGKTTQEADDREYETDFPWEAAGKVGYLTLKPLDFRKEGNHWMLEVEAKNEGHEPKSPFCGDAGAVLGDSSGNSYTGETVISDASDSCEELQPGLTGTYLAEFSLAPDAEPVIAGIYGDWEQEEDVKWWELP